MVITNKKVTMKKRKLKIHNTEIVFYNSADRLHCVLFALC